MFQLATSLTATDSDNTLLLSALLDTHVLATETIIALYITSPQGSDNPCLLNIYCEECAANCSSIVADWNVADLVPKTAYKAHLKYKCPLGQRFLNNMTNSKVEHQSMICSWTKSWTPLTNLMPCVRKLNKILKKSLKNHC